MEIIFGILVVMFAFFIGISCGCTSRRYGQDMLDYLPDLRSKDSEINYLKVVLESREKQIRFLEEKRCPMSCYRNNQTCHHCEIKKVYVDTPDKQQLLEEFVKAVRPFDEFRRKYTV